MVIVRMVFYFICLFFYFCLSLQIMMPQLSMKKWCNSRIAVSKLSFVLNQLGVCISIPPSSSTANGDLLVSSVALLWAGREPDDI